METTASYHQWVTWLDTLSFIKHDFVYIDVSSILTCYIMIVILEGSKYLYSDSENIHMYCTFPRT